MRRIILCFISFLFCWHCYAQLVFKKFVPSTYTPQTPDYSILQRSLERKEQRRIEADNLLNQLRSLCTETASQIPPSESLWFKNYCDSLCNEVISQIQIGNTDSAIQLAYDYMSNLRMDDKQVRYRIDSYKQYCSDMDNHGLYNYKNGKVTQTTYEWFCITNPYIFNPKYNTEGILVGYNPVHVVSYLYPNINWDEMYQFVTSQGRTKEDIERMWFQYFNCDPDRISSLFQEFNVAKFCYEYFLSIRDNSDISQADKENLAKEIAKYNAILSDANGALSYDAFIDNLKNQLVVEPPKSCRKTSGTTSKKVTSKKSSPRRK